MPSRRGGVLGLVDLLLLIANAAAGLAVPPLRVGVIGTGCIGIEHLHSLHLCENVAIAAIADNHPASRQSALACLRVLGAAEGVAPRVPPAEELQPRQRARRRRRGR